MTQAFSKELPLAVLHRGSLSALLDLLLGPVGGAFLPAQIHYLWLELTRSAEMRAPVLHPGFARIQHPPQNRHFWRNLHAQEKHSTAKVPAVEKIMVHHYQNISVLPTEDPWKDGSL